MRVGGTVKMHNSELDAFPALLGACIDRSGAVTTYKKTFCL